MNPEDQPELGSTRQFKRAWIPSWAGFLLIALVSISVGLINLLPIPVLDGGHILIFAVEAIARRPLALKTRERINVIGLALVGLITIIALRNDVVRYIM